MTKNKEINNSKPIRYFVCVLLQHTTVKGGLLLSASWRQTAESETAVCVFRA